MKVRNYFKITKDLAGGTPEEWMNVFAREIAPRWVYRYLRDTRAHAEIVFVEIDGTEYIFDVPHGRCIGMYCISTGKHSGPRDSARMRGHPLLRGRGFHRGHLLAHSAGGGTDINLVSQRGSMNIGPFRRLERAMIKAPGCLYFVRLMYKAGDLGQIPRLFEQGMIDGVSQPRPTIKRFQN